VIRSEITDDSIEETTDMIRPEDIRSLTDFQRNTRTHLKRLKRTGRPELLTINGKAEVVVQNASAYQRLIESLEKLKRHRQEEQY
jgi:PHD/YefM family antitoxin component YafN of YafNO toxin-antitoxin module